MIKGLSEKRRFPRVGKLKIGIKDERGIPKSIDYFRADGRYAALFHQIYGEKPKQIEIVFPPVSNIDDAVEHYYKYYKSDGIFCMGDGETAHRAKGGKMEEIECADNCKFRNKECMPYLTLKFMIPKVPVIGLWHLTSKSVNSTLNTLSGIDLVTSMAGKAYGIPLQLSVNFEHSSVSGNGSRFPVLTITPIATTEQLIAINDKSAQETFKFFQTQDTKQIEAPKKAAPEATQTIFFNNKGVCVLDMEKYNGIHIGEFPDNILESLINSDKYDDDSKVMADKELSARNAMADVPF